ncbi:hypothetical protein DFH07DRAFT_777983 [Mycena maculata]|uniref:Uncharacterized protein n=1 Tax=Mycena maculata TaxID=230809 RepID=A0AAD7N1R2_9AGAR|nr:hypothetical protein DFH07DRAFT_777983 [Mycena maculata]
MDPCRLLVRLWCRSRPVLTSSVPARSAIGTRWFSACSSQILEPQTSVQCSSKEQAFMHWQHKVAATTPVVLDQSVPFFVRLVACSPADTITGNVSPLATCKGPYSTPPAWLSQPVSIRSELMGRSSMLIPKHILLHMDPTAFDVLAPWYDWHQDTPFPSIRDAANPLRLFMYAYMSSIQPSMINATRTQEEHEGWLISVFAAFLLGYPDPWNHPEFLALKEGFDLAIASLKFAETVRSRGALRFLVSLYDRRVKEPDDVAKHLCFVLLSRNSDGTSPYFTKLFEIRLKRYIQGVGHPPQLRNVEITEDEFLAEHDNRLLRANLILKSGSDSDMCPNTENWG